MRYPGAKRAAGVPETIIANIPYHENYFELYAGTGHIGLLKTPALINHFNDINPKQAKYLESKVSIVESSLSEYRAFIVSCTDALHLLKGNVYSRRDFIYLDPPYIAESRRSSRKLYKHEMLDRESHIELLQVIRSIDANIMISTKPNELYETLLHDWRKVQIKTIDRTGKTYYEVIYMNYPDTLILHEYGYIGKDKGERQANKRTVRNLTGKMERLPVHLRHACIKSMVEKYPDIAQHFLNTMHRLQ